MGGLLFECPECRHTSHQRRDFDDAIICLNCKLVTPETIHGYTVIAVKHTPRAGATRPGRVVLVDKGDATSDSRSRWITAWQGRELRPDAGWDHEWTWGHYFGDKALAEADFHMRAVRGY